MSPCPPCIGPGKGLQYPAIREDRRSYSSLPSQGSGSLPQSPTFSESLFLGGRVWSGLSSLSLQTREEQESSVMRSLENEPTAFPSASLSKAQQSARTRGDWVF